MDGSLSTPTRRVAVLYGGESAEREVSLASGQQAALALSLAGHYAVLMDPAEMDLQNVDWSAFDVCFIALHGGAGEDGRVQAELDQLGVRYTGSSPAACALAMRKSAAKQRFADRGVPTPSWRSLVATGSSIDWSKVTFPIVIKPDSQGSSLGVNIAQSAGDVSHCVRTAAQYDSDIIAETLIAGREFTISLLNRDPLPLLEIVPPAPIFSYEAKYSSAATQYRFDADLPAPIEAELYRAAISAADALGTSGLVRVDLLLDRQDRTWVLEVNTIPGLTSRSLSPRAARVAGIEMPDLVDWMIRDAIARPQARSSNRVARPGDLQVESGRASNAARIGAIP
jgi:D-alanine-D-alanine ligase